MKKIMVILDGAADLPVESFGGKTPLEAAATPNLDYFAENGRLGFMHPISENVVPGSDNALMSIFGNDPKSFSRGVFEAIGAGYKLKRGDLAFRTNLGTIENLKNRTVIDRRAGRTLTSYEANLLAEDINKKIKLPCKFEFKPTIQHRGVLVLRGGFSDNISDIDNEWLNPGKKSMVFRFSEPLDDDKNSEYSANIVNEFVYQAFKVLDNHSVNLERKKRGLLPANMIFLRGGGVEVPEMKQYKNWISINSMPLEIGIAKASGMDSFSFEYPSLKKIDVYENLYNGLNKSIKFAIKTIKKRHKDYSGCYIQFKETDVPGHDNKPYEKKKMIELIDVYFFGFLRRFIKDKNIMVVVSCDHSTPCKLKTHSSDPVPVLVYDGKNKDDTARFSEKESKKGSLGEFYGKDFIEKTGLDK